MRSTSLFPYALILAAIALIQSLLTLNLIDDITNTRGKPNRECLAQGTANVVGHFFATMSGCAMIGQSMISITTGHGKDCRVWWSLFSARFHLVSLPLDRDDPAGRARWTHVCCL
ncbi:SulP family inorganic anion transporter [Herbaspirillum sp. GCM10030257]|uniref:SulP family inorganic anion transporter n=1 Tax=Herbaspirillum sp. GCM10030257 TaxID=3273393 RepID=UPI00361759B0